MHCKLITLSKKGFLNLATLSCIALLSLVSPVTFALGFGDVKLYSFLEETLDAEIELIGIEENLLSQITVSLASEQEFKRAGFSLSPEIKDLQFHIQSKGSNSVIRVTSLHPFSKAPVEFLIDLSWPEGRLVRGYTFMLEKAPRGTLPLSARRPAQAKQEISVVSAISTVTTETAEEKADLVVQDSPVQAAPVVQTDPIVQAASVVQTDLNANANPIIHIPPVVQTLPEHAPSPLNVHASPTYQDKAPQEVSPAFIYRMQWLLIFVVFALLIVCSTLILLFIRRNKIHPLSVTTKSETNENKTKQEAGEELNSFTEFSMPTFSPASVMQAPVEHRFDKNRALQSPVVPRAVAPSPAVPRSIAPNPAVAYLRDDHHLHSPLPNEMTMKIELAKSYFDIGDKENAFILLEEVILRGTEWEKQSAERLLAEHV